MNYKTLGYKTYSEYLQSKHWRLMKAKIYGIRNNKSCWICKTTVSLNIHHRTYKRIGDEQLNDLVILCQPCHHKVHEFHKEHPYLSLWRATNLYRLKTTGFVRLDKKKLRRYKRKAVKKRRYTEIQKEEIEFNRQKLLRMAE